MHVSAASVNLKRPGQEGERPWLCIMMYLHALKKQGCMVLCRPKEQDQKAEKPESRETSREEQGAQAQSHAAAAEASERKADKDADQAAASQHAPGLPFPLSPPGHCALSVALSIILRGMAQELS